MTAVLAVALAACGQSTSRRPEVARYLKQVNRIEAQLVSPLRTVTQAGNLLGHQSGGGGRARDANATQANQAALSGAWNQIETLRQQLAGVRAPRSATRLRGLLLELIDRQASLIEQVSKLAGFLPGFAADLRPLGRASQRLQVALAQTGAPGATAAEVYSAKAAALRRFQLTLTGILQRLRRLNPPDLAKPDYQAQVSSLSGMSSTAGKLANALSSGAAGRVRPLLLAFDRAATSSNSVAAQKAQIAAVRAYNHQVAYVTELSRTISRERSRLANTLT